MSTVAKMIIVLTTIAVLSGGILAFWDTHTQPKIQHHRLEALKAAITEILPPHDYYEEIAENGMTFYIGKMNDVEDPIGIAFKAEGSGFQGKISMMVGVFPDFNKITGLKILEQIETPGLGTKIVEDPTNKTNPFWFSEQFNGLITQPEIVIVKLGKPDLPNGIHAITGATISSRAVARLINEAINRAKQIYQTLSS